MGNDIAKLFGIEKEERGLITILLIQSVFLGIFYGVFNITAHSLFLAKFDEIFMARAYIASGLVGIALTWLYTVLQARMRFHSFSIINLSFVLVVTLLLWYFVSFTGSNWSIIALFIMMGPLNLLALLSFYGTTGRLFTLRQGRRLFGFVDTGIVVGGILSSFSIPGMLQLGISTANIIVLSGISIMAVVVVQGVIGKQYAQVRGRSGDSGEERVSMRIFRDDSYIGAMGLFIALSVLVAFFVQYSFMAVTRARYPLEEDMASFLGLFEGSMMVFTLLIKTFIFSYLIKNHGLKVTLAVAPILVGLFVVIAVIIGSTMGYRPETGGFMIFFLILALSRLFSKALKDSLETPTFKVLYQTLSGKLKYSVQSAIDGTVNEIAALSSGLILTGLGALAFVKLIHFSWVLALIIGLWVFTALRLYNEYRRSVQKSIDTDSGESAGDEHDIDRSVAGAAISVLNNRFNLLTGKEYDRQFMTNTVMLNALIKNVGARPDMGMLPLLKRLGEDESGAIKDKRLIEATATIAAMFDSEARSLRDVSRRIDSAGDRRNFVAALFASGSEVALTDLIKLIRDREVEIRRYAIFIAGRQRVKELLPDICDALSAEELLVDACSVLLSFEKEAVQPLSSFFFRSTGKTFTRQIIIRLIAQIGGREAEEFLFQRLWAVHRDLRYEALKGLLKSGFSPSGEERDKVVQEIQDVIGLVTSNIAATVTLRSKGDMLLLESLDEETEWWKRFMFGLLSLIYDSKSIDIIRANLEGETVESVNLALEMIDIVVEDALKPRLTPLLDVVSEEEKLKSLFQFYPGEIPDYDELVVSLINTDYNRIGVWTKTCALKSLYSVEGIEDPDFVVALLFSPNKILREEALRYLSGRFTDLYGYCSKRIPAKYRPHLDEIVNGGLLPEGEIYNKVTFLKSQFPVMPSNSLIELAMDMKAGAGEGITPRNGFIAWSGESGETVTISWDLLPVKEHAAGSSSIYVLGIDRYLKVLFSYPDHAAELINFIERNLD